MRLRLKRFDPSTIKPHRNILCVGKRGTGKSVLLNDLMYHLCKRVDFALAMTPTEDSMRMFAQHIPQCWLYDRFSGAKIDALVALQRTHAKQCKLRSAFVCLDDCMYDKSVLKSVSVRDCFMNGRHYHITFALALQYCMDMSPDLRSNIDLVFALRENIISNKQKLWKFFFGMFATYDDFSKVMDRCTEDYSCIVLDNTTCSNKIEDCIFWYRADISPPPYRIGKPVFWQLSARFMKSDAERQEEGERAQSRAHALASQTKPGRDPIISIEREGADGKVLKDARRPRG